MMIKNILLAGAVAVIAGAAPASAVNLIDNGNFEAGNTGFTSGYGYVAPAATALNPEALYTIDTNPNNSHSSFVSYGDNTTGSGLFMIVNGSGTVDTPVWTSQTISLGAGTYTFGAFLSSAYFLSPAQVEFTVTPDSGDVISLGTFAAPVSTGLWSGVGSNFTLAVATNVVVRIVNQNTALSGNDFGIDDISLSAVGSTVPEPATWAMLVVGFALIGSARRRKAVVAA